MTTPQLPDIGLHSKSWTLWGTVVAAAIQAGEQVGMVPAGALGALFNVIQTVAAAFAVFGIRRRLPTR